MDTDAVVPGRKGFKGVKTVTRNGRLNIRVDVHTGKAWEQCEAGHIDLGRKQCRFNDQSKPLTQELLIAFVGTCFQFFLGGKEGFFIHASGVIKDGKAHIFAGPPGSGKTTVARLSKGLPVISDDFVCIKRSNGAYRAHSTPWYGRDKDICADITRIYFLQHGNTTALNRLDPAGSASEILSNSYCNVLHKPLLASILKVVTGVAAVIPCYRMRYCLADPLWKSIERCLK